MIKTGFDVCLYVTPRKCGPTASGSARREGALA